MELIVMLLQNVKFPMIQMMMDEKTSRERAKKKSTLEKLPSSDHAYGLTHFTHSCSLPLRALWTVQRELVS
jgi:hypothetical protein